MTDSVPRVELRYEVRLVGQLRRSIETGVRVGRRVFFSTGLGDIVISVGC